MYFSSSSSLRFVAVVLTTRLFGGRLIIDRGRHDRCSCDPDSAAGTNGRRDLPDNSPRTARFSGHVISLLARVKKALDSPPSVFVPYRIGVSTTRIFNVKKLFNRHYRDAARPSTYIGIFPSGRITDSTASRTLLTPARNTQRSNRNHDGH